jgi:glutaredoxin
VKGYYVVVDVGQMGNKAKSLIDTKNTAAARGQVTSPIIFVDGGRRVSASKL